MTGSFDTSAQVEKSPALMPSRILHYESAKGSQVDDQLIEIGEHIADIDLTTALFG